MMSLAEKEQFIDNIADFSINRYIEKHGMKQLIHVRQIFVKALTEVTRGLLNNGTFDEWEEGKHPRNAKGQFSRVGSAASHHTKEEQSEKSKTIAGVQRGKTMSFEQAMRGVNPKYNKGGGYKENCAACTAVFIARMKGYNIEALPAKMKNYNYQVFAANPNLAFIDKKTGANPNFEKTNAQSGNQLKEWLQKNIEQDGYYMLRYLPDIYAGSNHNIIVFKNPKGELIYFDFQKGKFYDKDFPESIEYWSWDKKEKKFKSASPQVLRIDDKELDTERFKIIAKKSRY